MARSNKDPSISQKNDASSIGNQRDKMQESEDFFNQALEEISHLAEIRVEMSSGSAIVRLLFMGQEVAYPSNYESVTEMIKEAVEFSRSEEFGN